ncbi:flagellar protein FlgN [Croceicoccus sp. F390]|uniref:Flagellar protein FlgN n=1 Tax=Croceicoccus esteveae TaxID=3075597 RepID=A0ABU2ZH21_9SPHN|nr:flagellar protein FlgN [Croceicoccus sp. F390]MDT0574712.1 flagellar protein FlgN [Croceicoccus sp. F390]
MTGNASLCDRLRQMIAVLHDERQALAALDLEGLVAATQSKQDLCTRLDELGAASNQLDAECVGLVQSARQINEVNRRIRNILAANVAARLEVMTGAAGLYRPRTDYARLPALAG